MSELSSSEISEAIRDHFATTGKTETAETLTVALFGDIRQLGRVRYVLKNLARRGQVASWTTSRGWKLYSKLGAAIQRRMEL